MANTIPCGECIHYYALKKAKPKKVKILKRGHCLYHSVYASNKPGNPVYPPGAKTAELPYGRHKIVLKRADQVVEHCAHAKKR